MKAAVSTDWNASDYASNSRGQFAWAMALIDWLALAPEEKVLDVGCGDGKISAEIARHVPMGTVVGIDHSPAMIDLAQQTWCTVVPNVEFRVADAQRLALSDTFDVAFSNSTLHWMPDHRSVLKGVAAALRSGGRLFFSMGGRGTASVIYEALDELGNRKPWGEFLAGAESPHYFYGIREYEEWLPQAGLAPRSLALVHKPMHLADQAALEGWIRTTWVPYANRIPEDQRAEFVAELAACVRAGCDTNEDGTILLPMVNLEVEAHKL